MAMTLDQRVDDLPTGPGVYRFLAADGGVLYVGKAVDLRARVRQYFQGHDGRAMVPFLVAEAADVAVVVTRTEKEALLLENTLIKQHQPRYNARLRDDSSFLHLRLDPREGWPMLRLARRPRDDGARWFGPYASASRARETLAWAQRVFPLRTCSDAELATRRRPCLLHQMGRCAAPCAGLVSRDAYGTLVEAASRLLSGQKAGAVADLQRRMAEAADALRFEDAARLRDLVRSIEATVERQVVVDPRLADRDVWGLWRVGAEGCAALLPVREGRLGEPRWTVLRGEVGTDEELLSSLLNDAYSSGNAPDEILVPVPLPDAVALSEVLGERRGRRVAVRHPLRGDKAQLLTMAAENARVRWESDRDELDRRMAALDVLATTVGLRERPARIECFDVSHLGGTHPVAAMSVLLDGVLVRGEFRRYHLKVARGGDDADSMREVLTRRALRLVEGEARVDLWVVDGGKAVLGVARAVLADHGLDVAVVGLQKPHEGGSARRDRGAVDRIVLPDRRDPLVLRSGHPALRLLQTARDAAHDHAVRGQRATRHKAALASALEAVAGLGPARRRALVRAFGSVGAVLAASEEELMRVPGIGPRLARAIREAVDAAAGGEP
jgi:excinuclease ABC subunit C